LTDAKRYKEYIYIVLNKHVIILREACDPGSNLERTASALFNVVHVSQKEKRLCPYTTVTDRVL